MQIKMMRKLGQSYREDCFDATRPANYIGVPCLKIALKSYILILIYDCVHPDCMYVLSGRYPCRVSGV